MWVKAEKSLMKGVKILTMQFFHKRVKCTDLMYSCPTLDTIVDFPLGPPVSSLSTLIHSEKQSK